MEDVAHGVSWEAIEHPHREKSADWYWVLGIIALAGSVTSIIVGDVLFGIVIILGAITMMLVGHRPPHTIPFEVGVRGIRVGNSLYPYATLEAYYLDETNHIDPKLLVKSKKLFMPLLVIPVPDEYITEIESLVSARLPEIHLEEPLAHKLLEIFGF